jgi:hypothetical protein
LTSLKEYFEQITVTDGVRGTLMEIHQLYFQLIRDGFCLFSWPPAIDLPEYWRDNIDGEP